MDTSNFVSLDFIKTGGSIVCSFGHYKDNYAPVFIPINYTNPPIFYSLAPNSRYILARQRFRCIVRALKHRILLFLDCLRRY